MLTKVEKIMKGDAKAERLVNLLVANFAEELTYGGVPARVFRATKIAKDAAALMGVTVEDVIETVREIQFATEDAKAEAAL